MKKIIHTVLLCSLAMLIGILGASCGTKSYINVNYRLPLSSYDLKGKKVFLEKIQGFSLFNRRIRKHGEDLRFGMGPHEEKFGN